MRVERISCRKKNENIYMYIYLDYLLLRIEQIAWTKKVELREFGDFASGVSLSDGLVWIWSEDLWRCIYSDMEYVCGLN